eukprot:scaffold31_cov263-Pinguiococcus_pyrenoidosus.AAC.42
MEALVMTGPLNSQMCSPWVQQEYQACLYDARGEKLEHPLLQTSSLMRKSSLYDPKVGAAGRHRIEVLLHEALTHRPYNYCVGAFYHFQGRKRYLSRLQQSPGLCPKHRAVGTPRCLTDPSPLLGFGRWNSPRSSGTATIGTVIHSSGVFQLPARGDEASEDMWLREYSLYASRDGRGCTYCATFEWTGSGPRCTAPITTKDFWTAYANTEFEDSLKEDMHSTSRNATLAVIGTKYVPIPLPC